MSYSREDDFREIDALWRKDSASLVACRGRRRIRKRCIEGKPCNRKRLDVRFEAEGMLYPMESQVYKRKDCK